MPWFCSLFRVKIAGCVTDNAYNMEGMRSILSGKLPELLCFGCCAFRLYIVLLYVALYRCVQVLFEVAVFSPASAIRGYLPFCVRKMQAAFLAQYCSLHFRRSYARTLKNCSLHF